VVFIHDTIALAHPQWCKTTNALNYRLLLPPSARHASRVAVPSHASARDVARYCQVPAARIDVVPLGVTPPVMPAREAMEQHRQQFGMHDPFLLAVSTIEPKKNFANLIRWFDVWKDAGLPQHLVIAGHWGWKTGDVRRALASSRYQSQIHLLGYVHQPLLPCLMAAADLLLMPSRYEGFGLPALEAMAVGTPVVVSDQGALPETVGPAGLVLPLDDARWQQEIPALLHDPQRLSALRDAGQHRAASMTWERTAERLLASFMRAAQ
jgi:glycosyltransferase involved in cell wall biosynthesis